MSKKPVALLIMDGYGLTEQVKGNAIKAAKTPRLDSFFADYPNTVLYASGLAVGLPDGQMGNSEVGHTNIGAGRVVYQMLVKISKDIEDGAFFSNKALLGAMENCKKNNSALHLFGLLSDGGVHSHIEHLVGIVDMARKNDVDKVYIHAFLDGRDVSPTSGAGFMRTLEGELDRIGVGKVASVMGRYYAMDRDFAWDRVEKAYNAMVIGEGNTARNAVDAIERSYEDGVTDEFVVPTVIEGGAKIGENDSIVCFNFRPDRARQITRTFVDPAFDGFERKKGYFKNYYVCMAQYDALMPNVTVAYPPEELTMTFGEYVSKNGLTQLRIAETQKYAHVTFFFNGGEETQFDGEERILIQSPDVPTFDLKPEMSAYEVTDAVLNAIDEDKFDVIILNFANCDMVGHTGIFEAAVAAVEAVDECVGKVVDKILEHNGKVLITADHGNADCLADPETGDVFTAHTTNPVPLIVIGEGDVKLNHGKLGDLAPTMLDMMGLDKPCEMTGESLIQR
ncbi:MAG: 2,3-bisphosphoglycerate-independent phosphoglycerate mutase [Clostridia bacterium]|nr:2,3-bisphosphoglycerate-independent phosphoglycerate mutase [Clostridia bacterium]